MHFFKINNYNLKYDKGNRKVFFLLFIILNNSLNVFSNDVLHLGAVIPEVTARETMNVVIEAERSLNYDIEIVTLPGERVIIRSNRGELDGEIARILDIDKIYTNLIRVPETVTEIPYYIYSNRDYGFEDLEHFFESDLVLFSVIGIKSKKAITYLKLYLYLHKKHKDLVIPLADAMRDYKKVDTN